MEKANVNPIASLERLKELGLDPAKFGSCSEPQGIRGWRNQIEKPTNMGCKFRAECKWATVPIPDKSLNGKTVMRPRPRYVKTRLIKPKRDGSGKDVIRENYCTCAQWHADLKRRHGKNEEIAEVCGGEGDPVLLMGTKRVTRDAEGNPIAAQDQPTYFKKVVPVFPDPEDNAELIVDIYSAASRMSVEQDKQDDLQASRDRRMAHRGVGTVNPKPESLGEGDLDDLKESLGTGNRPSTGPDGQTGAGSTEGSESGRSES